MNELEAIRNKKGLTYKTLSEICGISATTISNYEKGKVKIPQAAVIEKVMKALNRFPDIIKEKAEIKIKMKCLNENCPSNKNNNCDNLVVLEGRAPCFGKSEVKKKQKSTNCWDNSIKKDISKKAKNE